MLEYYPNPAIPILLFPVVPRVMVMRRPGTLAYTDADQFNGFQANVGGDWDVGVRSDAVGRVPVSHG